MARDATARLYDVDEDSLVFKKLDQTVKYDQGEIHFRAKAGKVIDLDKLRESIWATRLSGGTRSGVVKLEVTAIGEASVEGSQFIFRVPGFRSHFVLASDPASAAGAESVYEKMARVVKQGKRVAVVTGRVDGWKGRWPTVLRKPETKPRRLLVSDFSTAD